MINYHVPSHGPIQRQSRRKRTKSSTLTLTTNPPINPINHPTRNAHPNMIIHNLRNPIPTHRPNRPRQPHNIARRRIATLRNIPVRVLPRSILTQDQPLAGLRPRRRFEEPRVRGFAGWWEAAVRAGEVVWDGSPQRGGARHLYW